jgi:hypothetical protein
LHSDLLGKLMFSDVSTSKQVRYRCNKTSRYVYISVNYSYWTSSGSVMYPRANRSDTGVAGTVPANTTYQLFPINLYYSINIRTKKSPSTSQLNVSPFYGKTYYKCSSANSYISVVHMYTQYTRSDASTVIVVN